jgi:hypothetical protein
MKKLILAMSIVASCAASATDLTVPWTAPSGIKYTYHIDSESARKVVVSGDTIWTAKVMIEDEQGVLVAAANAIADGCDLAEPAGTAAMVDNDGNLLPGTAPIEWSLAAFATGHGKIADTIASYTCIAAMANDLKASKKTPTGHMENKENFMRNI